MGFEDVIPPVPTREQEIRYIERVEQGFRDQPLYKLYMNEAVRQRKLTDVKKMNAQRVENLRNFLIGSLIFGMLSIYPCARIFQRQRGVPWIWRYKVAPFTEGYTQDRNLKSFKVWLACTFTGASLYTYRYQTTYYYDEYLTDKAVITTSFD